MPLSFRLENVELTWQPSGVQACRSVSLNLQTGGIHALVGENGAGKTTLGHILSGVVPPDSGRLIRSDSHSEETINLAGRQPGLLPGAGLVRQRSIWPVNLEVWEAAILGRESRGTGRRAIMEQFRSTAAQWELENIPPRIPVARLNAPELQQAELTAALMNNPRLLVLDEPSLVWEESRRKEFVHLISSLAEKDVCVLLITHRIEDVFRFARRVTVLRRGKICGTWESGEISKKDLLEQMFGRQDAGAAAALSGRRSTAKPQTARSSAELPGTAPSAANATAPAAAPPPAIPAATAAAPPAPAPGTQLASPPAARGAALPPSPAAPPAFELQNAHVGSPVRRELSALSFAVYPKEILGIAGLWNEGLKTLEDTVCGSRPLRSGTIRVNGKEPGPGMRGMRRSGMGYVPSNMTGRAAALTLPAAENMLLLQSGKNHQKTFISPRKLYNRADKRLKEEGIQGSAEQQLSRFSGGTIQRIILQRELRAASSVLILADPAKGLDEQNRKNLFSRIRRCAQNGTAVLLLTPVPEEALELSDRLGVICNGRLSPLRPAGLWERKEVAAAMVKGVST